MKNFFLILSIIIICGNVSCSQTPKGIDPTSLYSLQLPDDLDLFAIIEKDTIFAKKYNCEFIKAQYPPDSEKYLRMTATNDTIENIFRYIAIYQKEKYSDALEQYISQRNVYQSWAAKKIYEEKTKNKNSYFIVYERTQINYNHGIPCGTFSPTNLNLHFLLNKYNISISYSDVRTKKEERNYIQDINNDIILASKFFTDILNQKQ